MERRLLLAYEDAIATRGKHKGQLKAKCPAMGTDGAIMWQALQMLANPYKVSIMQLLFLTPEQREFRAACDKFAAERPARYLDRDRVALESLGVW
jgi:hypothetical protein